jgi:hypothetical protein
MKNFILKNIFVLLFTVLLTSCISVKKYNEKLEKTIAPEKLRDDVDFAKHKLQQLHPNLYWYISKEKLDFKFDSLKTTLNKPLKPNEFHQKLAPIIAEVREGHLQLYPTAKRLTRKEFKNLEQQKGLLSQYNFVLEGDRIFVKDNADKIPNMNVGTEILAIKDIPTNKLIQKYRSFVTSDGFNETFHKYILALRWPNYFTAEFGILDRVKIETQYLVGEEFKFINDIEVTSRTSMFHADFFRDIPTVYKPFAALAYPFYLAGTAFSVKKKNGKFLLRNNQIFSLKKPKKNHFEGKVYVLINGSSFSASSIIASKLKAEKRAVLVGEETGGANDGTVAGRYATKKLPNSKLYMPIGLMLIQPNIDFTHSKKGVLPDNEIILTTQQILEKKDLEIDWIMNNIQDTLSR